MANDVINTRNALTFLNLDSKPQAKSVSKESTIENQINKGMQEAIHEYLVNNWKEYFLCISTDSFGVDRHKTNGDLVHTKDNTASSLNGEYRIVLPTDNGTTVQGKKVGKCFRIGTPQTYLQGVQTRACCYYTVDGETFYYKDGKLVSKK